MNINTKKYIETYVKIQDKKNRIIDLKLNYGQNKLYDAIKKQRQEKKPVRIIVLKARQIGFSTLTEAIIFKETVTHFNVNSGIITHNSDATNNLFNMSKRMYDNLPEEIKPIKQKSNAKELIFNNKENTGLNSKIKCMTAGASGVGRSDTYTNLHISELAFWGNNAEVTYLGLMQAVPNTPNTLVVIESTANGYEFFKDMWDKAVRNENDFVPVFVGWNEMEDYQMEYTGFDLTPEEKELQELYNLSLNQLTWRRWCIKNNCGGDFSKFKQEYPINPEEAFLASGTCPFDKEKIIKRIQLLSEPIKIGYFDYKYDGIRITDIKWVNDKYGFIKIYKNPHSPKVTKYCIGGDTAGDGSDYYTGHVLDAETGEQVAVLKHQLDMDKYTKQMYCLGYYYGTKKYSEGKLIKFEPALMAIESNFDSYPIRELERLKYNNQYVREKIDSYTGQNEKKFGFRTSTITRPIILSGLIEIVRDYTYLFNDKDTLEELITIIRNEKGRIEAIVGGHDDQMMGVAIAHECRKQVVFDLEPIEVTIKKEFDLEDNYNDYGEEIQII